MNKVQFEITYNGTTHNAKLFFNHEGGMMTESYWQASPLLMAEQGIDMILEWVTCGFWEGDCSSDELEADEYFDHAVKWKVVV